MYNQTENEINQYLNQDLKCNVSEWLKSNICGSESQLDTKYIPNSYLLLSSGNNNHSFRDFYSETNDTDLELVKSITYDPSDLIFDNLIDGCVDYENISTNYDYNKYTGYFKTNKYIKNDTLIKLLNSDSNDELQKSNQRVESDFYISPKIKKKLLSCIEVYEGHEVFIPPGMNLFHASMIFKSLLHVVKTKNMKIFVPEIIYSSDKYIIRYTEKFILTPDHKNLFYNFCYDYSNNKNSNKNSDNYQQIVELTKKKINVPPIVTKETFGRSHLNATLKIVRKSKLEEEKRELNSPYKLLSYEDTKKIFSELNLQIHNYNAWMIELWESVFVEYLSKNNVNKCIFEKLEKYSGGPIECIPHVNYFLVFLEKMPLLQTIRKLKHKFKITLSKHESEYKKKLFAEQLQNNTNCNSNKNKIDASELCGTILLL